MKKLTLCMLTGLLSACSPIDSMKPFDAEQVRIFIESSFVAKPAQQRIVLDLPKYQNWKKVSAAPDTLTATVRMIPVNENPSAWRQSIQTNVVGFIKQPNYTAKQFVIDDTQRIRAHCQQTQPAIYTNNGRYTAYRITMSACDGLPSQQQIVKLFNGSDGVYAVRYAAIAGNVSNEQIKKMTAVILNAEFENNPEYR